MFDFQNPIEINSTYLKKPHQIIYPIFLSHLSDLFRWNCMWCIYNSAVYHFNDERHPYPFLQLGYCSWNSPNLYKRFKHKYCNKFEPIEEYNILIKEEKIHNHIKIPDNFFFIL